MECILRRCILTLRQRAANFLKRLEAITEDFSEPENEEPTSLKIRMQVAPAKAHAFTEDFSEPEMDYYGNNGEPQYTENPNMVTLRT